MKLPTISPELAAKIVKYRPLSDPIRLQDLEDSARSQAWKKIILDIVVEYAYNCVRGTRTQPPFSRKIVEIERFALRAAILHECQNYLRTGSVWEEARKIPVERKIEKKIFSPPPPPRAIISEARPLGTFENQDGRH